MAKWPVGIRPSGKGIRVRVWQRGKLVYSETVKGNPYDKADLSAAIKYRERLLARLELGHSLRADHEGIAIFSDVAQRWLASLQIPEQGVKGYMNQLNHYWMPAYAGWAVNDITQADIKERLAGFGVKIKTQKNILIPLRGVLQHAGVYPNPAYQITWHKRETSRQKPEIVRYLPAERDKVIAALDKLATKDYPDTQTGHSQTHWARQAALYYPLLFAVGLRPGEALGLDWADYDGQWLSITRQRNRGQVKDTTKTGKGRRVYVPEWIRPRINTASTRFQGGPLFIGLRGGSLKDTKRLNKVWEKAHSAARVPLRNPYTCRHTRAAELLSRGVEPAEAASQLGHSVQMFLETYSEWISEYAGKRDMSKFEGNRQNTDKELGQKA